MTTKYERWKRTRLLEGFNEEDGKKLAVLLENQRTYNEMSNLPAKFARVSIPLVRRIFGTFVANNKEICIKECLDAFPNSYETQAEVQLTLSDGRHAFISLDNEAAETAKVAVQVYEEILARNQITGKVLPFLGIGLKVKDTTGNVVVFTE